MLQHFAIVVLLLALSLAGGMWGYEHYENLAWRDAFLNTAMLLGGMGPVNAPVTDSGKMFAGIYALYAGLLFLAILAIMITPVVHRILHRFHWEQEQSD
ncbi:MAG: hypothetical protein ACREJT_01490 [Myxococcota bacterium]